VLAGLQKKLRADLPEISRKGYIWQSPPDMIPRYNPPPGFTKCCTGMARGQYLALSKDCLSRWYYYKRTTAAVGGPADTCMVWPGWPQFRPNDYRKRVAVIYCAAVLLAAIRVLDTACAFL